MFHYVEYTFHGLHHDTMRSGPLNDLEGAGLVLQIKQRGGRVTLHKEGTKDNIQHFIEYRRAELSERQGRTINHAKKTRV